MPTERILQQYILVIRKLKAYHGAAPGRISQGLFKKIFDFFKTCFFKNIIVASGPVDECSDDGLNDCDVSATCSDLEDGFECTCNDGYTGSGTECSDVDECAGTNDCDVYADCSNIDGSYTCTCMENYIGDGNECVGKYYK